MCDPGNGGKASVFFFISASLIEAVAGKARSVVLSLVLTDKDALIVQSAYVLVASTTHSPKAGWTRHMAPSVQKELFLEEKDKSSRALLLRKV